MVFPLFRRFADCRRGAVLVEFALALPLLLMLLMGVFSFGQYIWVAHTAQQVANDAARGALAGTTGDERLTIARGALTQGLAAMPQVDPRTASIALDTHDGYLVARVQVDVRGALAPLAGFVPLPEPVLERSATVRLEPAA